MKIDKKYIAFHVLTAFYFIWLALFISLLGISLVNIFGSADAALARLLDVWIMLNFIMGATLFIAISLYKNWSRLFKVIMYSFGIVALTAIITLVLHKIMV